MNDDKSDFGSLCRMEDRIVEIDKVLAKPDFLDKIDKMINSYFMKFSKQVDQISEKTYTVYDDFMLQTELYPWLMPSMIAFLIFLVFAWLYYLSKLDKFEYLPQRRHFRLPRYLAKFFQRKNFRF